MLKMEIQYAQHHVVLRCCGRVVLGEGVENLRKTVKALSEERILLDLSGVTAMDAAGLGLLVELHNWARERRRIFQVVDPSPVAARLIAVTALHRVLEVVRIERSHDGNFRPLQRPQAMTA